MNILFSPILRLYAVVLIIDHASLLANSRPQTTAWIAYPNTPLQAKSGLSNWEWLTMLSFRCVKTSVWWKTQWEKPTHTRGKLLSYWIN